MNEVEGVVRRVVDGMAFVEIERATGCGRCHEPGGCGSGGRASSSNCRSYSVANIINAAVGDEVLVSVAKGSILMAAFWAYVLPGILMLTGALIASFVVGSDWAAVFGALFGLLCGYGLLRQFPRASKSRSLSMRFK